MLFAAHVARSLYSMPWLISDASWRQAQYGCVCAPPSAGEMAIYCVTRFGVCDGHIGRVGTNCSRRVTLQSTCTYPPYVRSAVLCACPRSAVVRAYATTENLFSSDVARDARSGMTTAAPNRNMPESLRPEVHVVGSQPFVRRLWRGVENEEVRTLPLRANSSRLV